MDIHSNKQQNLKIAVIIPAIKQDAAINSLIENIKKQKINIDKILILLSLATDDLKKNVESSEKQHSLNNNNFVQIHRLDPNHHFNHGTTRQLGVNLIDADIYIFMTADAILANEYSIRNLLYSFDDKHVGCAYGRQLPRTDANLLAAHARLFNYPEDSHVRGYYNKKQFGIKTCFISNSFAAYRKQALIDVGGFPNNIPMCEDMYVAAKMLISGWKVIYQATAQVFHSHNYNIIDELRRYFDIGMFHANNQWIRENFGGTSGEGLNHIKSEIKFCLKNRKYLLILSSLMHTCAKATGFLLGLKHNRLPKMLCKCLSMYGGGGERK